MKSLPTILVAAASLLAFGTAAYADIQAPPMTEMGPTRKFGRGFSNVVWGFTEIPVCIAQINEQEGNSAACGYGVVRGIGRTFFRFGNGLYEMMTFPAPCYKSSYRPPYNANTPWKIGTYDEFPPELGWESRFDY